MRLRVHLADNEPFTGRAPCTEPTYQIFCETNGVRPPMLPGKSGLRVNSCEQNRKIG